MPTLKKLIVFRVTAAALAPLIVMVIFLFFYILHNCPILNHRWERTTYLELYDGSQIIANEQHSDARCIDILPHTLYLTLGKGKISNFEWIWNDTTFRRKTFFIPVIFNVYEGNYYLVEFDRETNFPEIVFRFFRLQSGAWKDIAYSEFPKPIAVQNMWLNRDSQFEALKNMDPNDRFFQSSMTAHLWVQLETGQEFFEIGDPGPSLLEEFKHKYIAPEKFESIQHQKTSHK